MELALIISSKCRAQKFRILKNKICREVNPLTMVQSNQAAEIIGFILKFPLHLIYLYVCMEMCVYVCRSAYMEVRRPVAGVIALLSSSM